MNNNTEIRSTRPGRMQIGFAAIVAAATFLAPTTAGAEVLAGDVGNPVATVIVQETSATGQAVLHASDSPQAMTKAMAIVGVDGPNARQDLTDIQTKLQAAE